MQQPQRRRPWHRNTRQDVLLEYANLKDACPEGIYVSLTPGNPTQWSGVLFVRKGPYAPAILRFLISFPSGYPGLPPLVTFTTDIFHPLVTPLTTYTYTTGSLSSNPVSATDEERLPPGGFSLSDAFPHWYGRSEGRVLSLVESSRDVSAYSLPPQHQRNMTASEHFSHQSPGLSPGGLSPSGYSSSLLTPTSSEPSWGKSNSSLSNRKKSFPRQTGSEPRSDSEAVNVSIIDVLEYVKTAFDDDELLDGLPLEAAANLGAWKAWQAHRRSALTHAHAVHCDHPNGQVSAAQQFADRIQRGARRPDEWNWDGVWKERVKRGIEASISDQVVFGAGGGGGDDDIIHFIDDEDVVCEVKGTICDILSRST